MGMVMSFDDVCRLILRHRFQQRLNRMAGDGLQE
jgi:hypothetical protein